MSNPVEGIIKQIPKSKRLSLVKDLQSCTNKKDVLDLAKRYDISLTEQQYQQAMEYLRNDPPEAELRSLVAACVPFIAVGPTLAILKQKLGRN